MVIPSTYHQVILEELHAEHSDISQTKAFASGGLEWMLLLRIWCRNALYVSQ